MDINFNIHDESETRHFGRKHLSFWKFGKSVNGMYDEAIIYKIIMQ